MCTRALNTHITKGFPNAKGCLALLPRSPLLSHTEESKSGEIKEISNPQCQT